MAPNAGNRNGKFLSSSVGGSGKERSSHPHPHPHPHHSPKTPAPPVDVSKLLGTIDVRQSVLTQREKRATLGLVSQDGPLGSGNVELSSYIVPHQSYKWEIDPTKLVLKKYIAKGTHGTVHRGFYRGRDVAVKLLDWGEDDAPARGDLRELREAFIQEVTVWSKLDHRNVTQFIGAILGGARGFHIPSTLTGKSDHMLVDGHVSCVVLEYVAGGTLKAYITKHKDRKLGMKVVVQLAMDIARGLAYLHSKRIVHRDVKSDNMLVDKKLTVKIADFGVSRIEQGNVKSMRALAGTYGYMAPEVLLGNPYDHKVDVYSFGILLWEIYCCKDPFPFHQFTPTDIKNFVTQGLRPEMPACCPPQLGGIMTRCWDKDADNRPDMEEVVRLLEGVDVKHGGGGMRPTISAEYESQAPCGCMPFGR